MTKDQAAVLMSVDEGALPDEGLGFVTGAAAPESSDQLMQMLQQVLQMLQSKSGGTVKTVP